MKNHRFKPLLTILAVAVAGTLTVIATPSRAAESAASDSSIAAKGIAGKWKVTMDGFNGGQIERDLTLTQTGDSYTGRLSGFRIIGGNGGNGGQGAARRAQPQELQEITFKDGDLTFTTSFTGQDGQAIKRTYKGHQSGDVIEGTIEGGQNSRKWRATRSASGPTHFDGIWDVTINAQGGATYKGVLTLQGQPSQLTGDYLAVTEKNDIPKVSVSNVSAQDDTLKFAVDLQIPGQTDKLHVDFSGMADGDTMTGQQTSSFGSSPFTAARRKDGAASSAASSSDLSGEWDITVTTPNRTYNTTLNVKKEGSGYAGDMLFGQNQTRRPLKSLTVDGKTFKAVTEFERNGQTVTREMTGTFEGDLLKGEWKTQNGTTTFTGKRKGGSSTAAAAADVIGEWDLTIETPNGGKFNPTVAFRKEGNGYAGDVMMGNGNKTPLKSVTMDGDTLKFIFEITPQNGGDKVAIEHTLKVSGDSLSGESKSSLGTSKITGKRKAGP